MHLDQSICHLLLLFRQQSIQNRDFVEVFHLRFWQVCTLRCTTPACHSLPNLKKETHPQNQAVSFSITAPHDSPSAFMTYTSPPSPVFSSRPSRAAYALILESEACAAAERRGEGPEIPKPNRGRTRRAVGFLGGSGRWAVPQVIQVRRTPKFRTPKAPSKLRDFLEERVSTNPAEDILDHLRGGGSPVVPVPSTLRHLHRFSGSSHSSRLHQDVFKVASVDHPHRGIRRSHHGRLGANGTVGWRFLVHVGE